MRLVGLLKSVFRFTIPVKVVLLTGAVYVVVWAIGVTLAYIGVDFSSKFFGVEFGHLYLAFEVLSISVAATLGTHLFLDKPLSELTGAMAKAESGDFLIRAPQLSEDELGDLAKNFNRMLTRITDLAANNIQTDQDLKVAQEQLLLRNSLEEKNDIIQRTNSALEKLVRDLFTHIRDWPGG